MLVGLIALYAGPCVQLPKLTAHVSLSVLLTLRNDQSAFGNIFAFSLQRTLRVEADLDTGYCKSQERVITPPNAPAYSRCSSSTSPDPQDFLGRTLTFEGSVPRPTRVGTLLRRDLHL